jgi:anti-anti-sigma factor
MDGSRFRVERREGIHLVRVLAELDLYSAPGFERALAPLDAARERLVVDLTACRYIDSAGFAVLIRYHRALGGRLSLAVAPDAPIRRAFAVAGLSDLLATDPVAGPDGIVGSPQAVA